MTVARSDWPRQDCVAGRQARAGPTGLVECSAESAPPTRAASREAGWRIGSIGSVQTAKRRWLAAMRPRSAIPPGSRHHRRIRRGRHARSRLPSQTLVIAGAPGEADDAAAAGVPWSGIAKLFGIDVDGSDDVGGAVKFDVRLDGRLLGALMPDVVPAPTVFGACRIGIWMSGRPGADVYPAIAGDVAGSIGVPPAARGGRPLGRWTRGGANPAICELPGLTALKTGVGGIMPATPPPPSRWMRPPRAER